MGIILPYLVVPDAGIFLLRQYLMGIPKDFLDAARVDGCTEYGIFFKIMIPLMKPSFSQLWGFIRECRVGITSFGQ
ncbi:MAG: ABC transporter permease subunit [Blautia obeum]